MPPCWWESDNQLIALLVIFFLSLSLSRFLFLAEPNPRTNHERTARTAILQIEGKLLSDGFSPRYLSWI